MSADAMLAMIDRQTQRAGMPAQQQGADPAAAAAQQQASAAHAEAASKASSKVDAAVRAAQPTPDGDQEPTLYRFKQKVGDQEHEVVLSEGQILGTMGRYSKLNARHQQLKPAIAVVEKMMAELGDDPEAASKIAARLESMMSGQGAQPQARAAAPEGAAQSADAAAVTGGVAGGVAGDVDLDSWGDSHGIDVAPIKGLTKAFDARVGQIETAITQLANAMKVLADRGALQQQDAIQQGQQQVQQGQQSLSVRQVQANLQAVQNKYQLPDDMEPAFIQFAAMRGYTLADFSDAELADMVAGDFVNAMRSPERDRLMEQLQRRQAFTGSLGSAPAVESGAAPVQAGNGFIDRMVSRRM
jgi:hypothetical protein